MNKDMTDLSALLGQLPLQIPAPGKSPEWTALVGAYKERGIHRLPFRSKQAALFGELQIPGLTCADLSCGETLLVPAHANEHHGRVALPAGINCVGSRSPLRPDFRLIRFRDVEVVFGTNTFTILDRAGAFDPVSGRIPAPADIQRPADARIKSAVITIDRYGATNISHYLFDAIGRYLTFRISAHPMGSWPDAPPLLLPLSERPIRGT